MPLNGQLVPSKPAATRGDVARTRRPASPCQCSGIDRAGFIPPREPDTGDMAQFLSALWGGLLALLGSVVVTTVQARIERRSTREARQAEQIERLRSKREELYIDLLRTPPVEADQRRAWRSEVDARASAFGSTRVNELLKETEDASEAANVYASEEGFMDYDQRAPLDAPTPDRELTRLMEASSAARQRLRDQIREDLGTRD